MNNPNRPVIDLEGFPQYRRESQEMKGYIAYRLFPDVFRPLGRLTEPEAKVKLTKVVARFSSVLGRPMSSTQCTDLVASLFEELKRNPRLFKYCAEELYYAMMKKATGGEVYTLSALFCLQALTAYANGDGLRASSIAGTILADYKKEQVAQGMQSQHITPMVDTYSAQLAEWGLSE